MASINGLSLRNIRQWVGREGPACQGSLYLGDTKICFWSQDGNGGMDIYDFERIFSKEKFNNVIDEIYQDKKYSYTFGNEEREMKYDVDLLMIDIVELEEKEQDFKKYCTRGYKGIAIVSNWRVRQLYPLTSEDILLNDNELKGKLSFKINKFVEENGKDELKVEFFRDKKDFHIGKEIDVKNLYDIRRLKDFYSWDSIQLPDKLLTKDEFLKMSNEDQNKYLNMEVIPSNSFGLFFEKDYYLEKNKQENDKDFEMERDER